jgi:hypothetical protein
VRANNTTNPFGSFSVQSASILRTILDTVTFDPTGIAFTGSIIADENNTTNYYTLATTDPNLSRLQVVDLIENSPTSFASVGSNISANSNVVTDSILTQIVDVNSNVYSATAVNKAYVYTYAIDESGSNNHRDIDRKEFINYEDVTLLSDKNVTNTSANQTLNPTFVGGEPMASSYILSNGDIVYMKTDGGDSRDGAQLFDGNIAGGWANASQGASGTVPMTWAYKFTDEAKHVSQMKFVQPPDSYPIGNITISYYDTSTWKNVTSPDKTGFNTSVAPVYAESITIKFDGAISQYWKITADTHTQSPSSIIGLYEWEIWGGNRPYVTISDVAEIVENDLTLILGSVFSSVANIIKYYVVAFVTSAPSGSVVDTATIDETTIATFITSWGSLTGTGYKTLFGATGNNMYYNEDGVAKYEVENITNITIMSAFRTLTPTATDGSEIVDITTTSGYSFIPYVIVVDAFGNIGINLKLIPPATGTRVSASVNTSSGTPYSLAYTSSSLSDMTYKQLVPNGDYIHSSNTFVGYRNVISLIDIITNSWNNAWHGPHGITTMYAIYEFVNGDKKFVSSMDFSQVPGNNHYTGVINIYYWDGSVFVEVSYTNDNQFINTIYGETINISFDVVESNQFKIRVNRHTGNRTTYIGLSEWTLKH